MTTKLAQETDFTRDVLGRYICNGLDEALASTNPNGQRADGTPQNDAKPFDTIIIGGVALDPSSRSTCSMLIRPTVIGFWCWMRDHSS